MSDTGKNEDEVNWREMTETFTQIEESKLRILLKMPDISATNKIADISYCFRIIRKKNVIVNEWKNKFRSYV